MIYIAILLFAYLLFAKHQRDVCRWKAIELKYILFIFMLLCAIDSLSRNLKTGLSIEDLWILNTMVWCFIATFLKE
jgi:hypothetical protein